ncbi:MAG TPA: hypothetical protein VIK27_05535 [Candidatus Aquilonibacter sp.]
MRTGVFEPLAIASLARLIGSARESGAARVARWVLAIALVIFGVDHFLALGFITSLVPAWIPLHVFWAALFGAAFIACAMALTFGVWVVTLHLPRTLGFYGIPGAMRRVSRA